MTLRKNLIANYLGAGWAALMMVAFVPLYIRFLGIEAFGLIGLFAMLQGWLTLLDLGMAPAISRQMALAGGNREQSQLMRDLLRSVEIVAGCLALSVAACLWFASEWLASSWLHAHDLANSSVTQAFALMGVVIGLRLVENIYRSSLIGMQRQVDLNLILVATATLRGLGAVGILAWVSPTLTAYFLWQGLVSLVSVGLFASTVHRALPRALHRAVFSRAALRSIGGFAAGAMAIACLSLLLTSIDKILLSRLLPLEAFGYYAFALAVAQTPLGLVAPLAQAFYPRFTQLSGDNEPAALAVAYHSASQLVTVLLGSATVMLVVFGDKILSLWTKDPVLTDQTYRLAAVLALGSLLNGLMTIPYYLQLSDGWTGLTVRANLIALVLVVPALVFFIPMYGAIAAAWVWLLLNTGYIIAVIPLIHRRLLRNEKWTWYIRDVAVPLSMAAAGGIALRCALLLAQGTSISVFELMICAAVVIVLSASAAPLVRTRALALFARQ